MEMVEPKLVDNLMIFANPMSPSHLSVGFDLAERFNESANIYDVRYPMLESVRDFKSRKNFKLYNFNYAMEKSEELKRYVDESTMKRSADIFAVLKMIKSIVEILIVPCKKNENLFNFSQKRNLALIDIYSSGCYIVISRKHKARIVYFAPTVEPFTVSSLSGAPLPGYSMSLFKSDPRLNFHVRLANVFAHGVFEFALLQIPLAKWWYNGDDRNYKNLEKSIIAVNSHKYMDFPLPRTPLIVEMGNLVKKETKPLDDKVQKFINSYESIVYFSMSTYSNDGQLPVRFIKEFTATFKRFPKVGFIWRLKEDLVDSSPNNVLFVDWVDQRSLLGNQKVKLLITHCGMNSVLEAFHSGVPMIGIPTMGDQFPTSERIKRLKTGIVLDLHSLNEIQLSYSIRQILKPDSVESRSAKKIRDMLGFEREKGISLDGTFALRRFMKVSQETFERFWVPKNINWLNNFYLDWVLVLVLVIMYFS